MKLPTHNHYDSHRKTTWLYFDDDTARESIIRGGMCFPIAYRSLHGINTKGYAVVAGQDLADGKIYIYSQRPWVTIENILATEGDPKFPVNAVKYPGLSHWFNEVWKDYYCNRFYYAQPEELSRRFRLQISRSFMIGHRPYMIEVPICSTDDFMSVIWHWIKSEKIIIEDDSEIMKDLGELKVEDKDVPPSLHALGCCLLSYDRFPWRAPYKPPVQEVFVR